MPNEIKLKIKIDEKEAVASLQLTDDNIKELYKSFKYGKQQVNGLTTQISMGFNNAREIIGGVRETYQSIVSLFQKPIQARVELEQAQVSFKVLFNSADKADQRIKELYKFTSTTPFQLNEVIAASRQLEVLTQGALSSGDGLRLVGDVASGVGAPINELSMWFGRLYDGIQSGRPVGEALMRLQELGVLSGDVRSQIENLSKSGADGSEVWNVFTDAMSKFNGMMDEQSNTLGGQVSNFEDNITQLQTSVGGTIAVALSPFLEHINEISSSLNESFPMIVGVVGAVGTLTAALTILNTTGIMPVIFRTNILKQKLIAARFQMNLMRASGYGAAGGLRAASMAAKGFFASLGPVGWAILGFTALLEILHLFASGTDDAAHAMSAQEKELIKQKTEFESLIKLIKDVNTEESVRASAIADLNEKYPEYLGKLDLEKAKNEDIETALKAANDEFERKIELAALETMLQEKTNSAAEKYTEILKKQNELKEYKKEHPNVYEEVSFYSVPTGPNSERRVSLTAGDEVKRRNKEINELQSEYDVLIEKTNEFRNNFSDSLSQKNTNNSSTEKTIKNIKSLSKKLSELKTQYNSLDLNSADYEKSSKRIKTEIIQTVKELKKYKLDKKEISGETEKELGLLPKIDKKIQELNKQKMFAKDINSLKNIEKKITELKNDKVIIEAVIKGIPKFDFAEPEDIILPDLKIADDQYKDDLSNEVLARANGFEEEYRLLELWKKKELALYKDDQQAKTLIEKTYSRRRESIAEKEMQHKFAMTRNLLGLLNGVFNANTAAAKAIAVTQAIINTYQGAAAALAPPPIGAGPLLGPALAAITIATGMVQVHKIASTEIPTFTAYATGGAIVGEKGMEIIAPAKDYATGFSELITQTILTVEHNLKSQQQQNNSVFINEKLTSTLIKIEQLIENPVPSKAYMDDKEARKLGREIDKLNRKSKL